MIYYYFQLLHNLHTWVKIILQYQLLDNIYKQFLFLDLEGKYNAIINSNIQMMVYQFTIFNPIINLFPACHVPTPSSQRHKVINLCISKTYFISIVFL